MIEVRCDICVEPAVQKGIHVQIHNNETQTGIFKMDLCEKHAKMFMNQTEKLIKAIIANHEKDKKIKQEG